MLTSEVEACADLERGQIVLRTDWRDKEMVKLIPGSAWDPNRRAWVVPLSWAACLQLRGVFGTRLAVNPDLRDWSWNDFRQRVQPSLEMRDQVTDSSPRFDKRLYEFQRVGARWLADVAKSALLGDELGLGKTITALTALARVDGLPALVISPNSVKTAWKRQARVWYPEATPYVVHGGAATRRKILAAARTDSTALVVVNIEAVRIFSRLAPFGSIALRRCRECDPRRGQENVTVGRCEVHARELNGFGFETVIVDEAHRIKDPRSAQTRACWAVGHDPSVRRRWALTGTPVANNVADLWAIMHFLEPNEWPTKSKWVDRYALTAWNPFGGLDVVGINPQTRGEFYQILDARFRRTPKALVLAQLPTKIRSTRWVEMVPKQKKAYDELAQQLITRLDTGEVLVAPNQLIKMTRLLQLSSSYAEVTWIERSLHIDDKCWCFERDLKAHADDCQLKMKIVVTLAEPSPKLDVMEEIIAERGAAPMVVSAMSRQLVMLASKRLERAKIPHGLIVGGVSDYERQQVIDRFRRNEIQVVLFTLQAGGTGVDGLQHSDTMLCLQRSWSMLDNVQGEGRIDRIGSEKHDGLHVIDVVAQDTIEEEALFPRLLEKFTQLDEINRDRARLAPLGIKSPELFVLEQREQRILASDLGSPGGK